MQSKIPILQIIATHDRISYSSNLMLSGLAILIRHCYYAFSYEEEQSPLSLPIG